MQRGRVHGPANAASPAPASRTRSPSWRRSKTGLPAPSRRPSQSRAVIRYAGRDTAASVTGIDPRREAHGLQAGDPDPRRARSTISTRPPTRSSSATGWPAKIGARVGNTIVLVVGHRPAHVVHGRRRCSTPASARPTRRRPTPCSRPRRSWPGRPASSTRSASASRTSWRRARSPPRIEAQTGYKSVSWQEANEDLLSALQIRNFIMYTVVGAILLVASFGTYNIISTITHEKTRDIAILKSLGFTERDGARDLPRRGADDRPRRHRARLDPRLSPVSRCSAPIEFKSPFMDATHLPIYYSPVHYLLAGGVALTASAIAGYLPARKAAQRASRRHHPGRVMSDGEAEHAAALIRG